MPLVYHRSSTCLLFTIGAPPAFLLLVYHRSYTCLQASCLPSELHLPSCLLFTIGAPPAFLPLVYHRSSTCQLGGGFWVEEGGAVVLPPRCSMRPGGRLFRSLSEHSCLRLERNILSPRRFRAKILSPTQLHVSWKEPKGEFESYKVVYSTRPGAEQKEIEVSKQDAMLLIDDFDPSKEYNFKVVALNGGQQSKPLQAKHEAQQSGVEMTRSPRRQDDGENNDISEAEDEFMCKTSAISDIVILVDGSWSIGRINFRLIRTFLENLVRAFSVEFDKTRIGLAQYSGDPRIEWHLNAHTTKEAVIEAVKNLPYKGGNTLTGLALTFILETSFKPESGSRPGVPKVGILITDGKSQDDVIPPARSLREAGIELFAIGVKNADENELKAIASPPEETHVYNVADFSVMSDIVESLTKTVCERVEQLDKQIKVGGNPAPPPVAMASPGDLVTSDITARSFRVTWTHAPGQVEKYRVVFYPASGGRPEEKVVQGVENSVELSHLNSLTEYQLAVFAVYRSSASEALRGSATTLALPMVNDLELFDIAHSSMTVRWKTAAGASGYMILYAPLTGGEPADEKEVKVEDTVNQVELEGLTPATEYTVTVYALYGEEASDPMTSQQTTLPLTPATDLRFSDVDHSSSRLTWAAAAGKANGYRIMYVKTNGVQTNEVDVGRVTTWLLRNLTSLTEYTVGVFAVYDEGQAEAATDSFTTTTVPDPQDLRSSDVSTDSFRVSWQHPASDVVMYRLSWAASDGGDSEEVLVNGNIDSYLIGGLGPLTEYEVVLAAVYANGAESDEVVLVESTVERTTTVATTTTTRATPRYGIRSMRVDEETTFSLRVAWQPTDPRNVRHYRLSYVSAKGDRAEEQRRAPAGQNSLVLQPLLSDTEYRISITPVYPDGDGPPLVRTGRTLPLSPPTNLRVSEEWYNRFRISWDVPPSPTMGYRVVYQPQSALGPALETFVGEDVNTMLIVNLLSGTEYSVKVIASYTTGSSEALSGGAKTLHLGVSGLNAYQVTVSGVCAQWQPQRHASSYRLLMESLHNGHKQETKLSGGANQHCFNSLKADTQYRLSVRAQLQDGTEGPEVSVTERTLPVPTPKPTAPPTTTPLPTIPAAKEVCKAARADLVFLVDGSWSIGDDNFLKIIRFLYSTAGALDRIGPDGTQVAIAQFSDDARTEFKLNSHSDKERLLDAINRISYKGGNTKTGRAIQHVKENIFTAEGGVRRGIPNVLVVLTDGRSQDDVNKVSKEMQMEGFIVFAIGFADADYGELVSIASKPSDRHVFFVDDLDAFTKIEEKLVTFVCEAATATCPSVPMSGSSTPGFRMMELFGLVESRYGSVAGVSMVPGTFNTFPCFHLHADAFLAQPTRYIHPEGLPSDYTISLLFRLLPDTPEEPFALWEVLDQKNEPLVGVILDHGGKTLTFFNNDFKGDFQTVTFEGPDIKKLFYGSFHKLHIAVSKTSAKVLIDCSAVDEKSINAAGNISTDGAEVLGRKVRSRGNKDSSAPFQLQSFDIVCSTSWANRDKCCELPGLRKEEDCPAMPKACTCTQDSKGPPGPAGPPGGSGIRGARGDRGEPGPVGPTGAVGDTGLPGPQGPQGPQGHSGRSIIGPPGGAGERGQKGEAGQQGVQGLAGRPGAPGREGPAGPRGLPGNDGPSGRPGPSGTIGTPGAPGAPGNTGSSGKPGDLGPPGLPGSKGERGERGDLQSTSSVQDIARQVCEQLIQSHMSRYNSILNHVPSPPVSIRTVPGPPGEPGRQGTPGPQGEQGPSGRPGFPGQNGENGQPGERGQSGEKGDKGSPGVGVQGPRGPPGPPGAMGQGRPGSQGPSGRPGNPGSPGRPGNPGPVGSAGSPGYCDQNSCVGYNVGVQLPPNVFQNYDEVAEEDPYRFYEPNYPAPRPVAPDDPAFQQDGVDLSSHVARTARSTEGGGEKGVSLKRRVKDGAMTPPGLI
ncbi:collagen alpha-1(XIV) chain isoform 2-T2 [Spinachia spinachia]